MRRRWLRIVGWSLGSLVLIVLSVIAINAFDEELAPETRALLSAPPNPYRADENLYLAVAGFDSRDSRSSVAAGQARIAAYEAELAAAAKEHRPYRQPAIRDADKLAFNGKIDFCRPLFVSCLFDVEAHAAEIERLTRENAVLYRRYEALRQAKGYYETATPSVDVPFFLPTAGVHQLYLARIALRVRTGGPAQQRAALSDLHGDVRAWRVMLRGEGTLLSKMVSIAQLQGDEALLADIVADRRLDWNACAAAVRAILDELSEDDWKIGSVYAPEFRFSEAGWVRVRAAMVEGRAPGVDSAGEEPGTADALLGRIAIYFMKPNATSNLHAQLAMQLRRVADADPGSHSAADDAFRQWSSRELDPGLHWIYNPMGKAALAIGRTAFDEYPLRASDGVALHRLVRLAYEIRERRVAAARIPEFLRAHGPAAAHPLDGRPFAWDGEKRELSMQPVGKQQKDRRFGVPVWTAL